MNQKYADWRGSVISERSVAAMADYIPEEHRRRMQCADVLCRYLAGASDTCYRPGRLPDSMFENWTDTAPLYVIADALAGLVLLGFRFSGDDTDATDAANKWLRTSGLVRAMRKAERTCCAAGDAVVLVRWNETRREPELEAYLPGMYLPLDGDSSLLFWGRPEPKYADKLFVEHYTLGQRGRMVSETTARITGGTMSGVRSGWVAASAASVGSSMPLHKRIDASAFTPIGIDRLPLVHIPNGDTDIDGWGTSDFWQVMGLFDMYNELMADRRKGARFLQPPMVVWGDRPPLNKDNAPAMKYAPNSIYYVGENGGMNLPDFSNMLKATHDEQQAVWQDILVKTGICRAMLGDVGEVTNRRDREVRLMYMPGQTKVQNRRDERMPHWSRVLGLVSALWQAKDPEGFKHRLLGADLGALGIELDPVLPEDIAERVNTLTTVKASGGIDRETYTEQAISALGITGDPAEIAARAATEDQAVNGMTEWPRAGADQQQ